MSKQASLFAYFKAEYLNLRKNSDIDNGIDELLANIDSLVSKYEAKFGKLSSELDSIENGSLTRISDLDVNLNSMKLSEVESMLNEIENESKQHAPTTASTITTTTQQTKAINNESNPNMNNFLQLDEKIRNQISKPVSFILARKEFKFGLYFLLLRICDLILM